MSLSQLGACHFLTSAGDFEGGSFCDLKREQMRKKKEKKKNRGWSRCKSASRLLRCRYVHFSAKLPPAGYPIFQCLDRVLVLVQLDSNSTQRTVLHPKECTKKSKYTMKLNMKLTGLRPDTIHLHCTFIFIYSSTQSSLLFRFVS